MPKGKVRFLIDVGVGKKVEEWLKADGYDVKTVRSIDPKARDVEILKIAKIEFRMVVTMDKDFGELIYKSGKSHSGVLILRLEDAKGSKKVEVLKKILHDFEDEIENRFCVFQNNRLRISR